MSTIAAVVTAAMFPVLWYYGKLLIAQWRMTRKNQHFRGEECQNCGYCLAGNVSGVCPECGT
ncbi:MAG: hypothetical protein ACREVM_10005, partial [Burkholderiales bacterium]